MIAAWNVRFINNQILSIHQQTLQSHHTVSAAFHFTTLLIDFVVVLSKISAIFFFDHVIKSTTFSFVSSITSLNQIFKFQFFINALFQLNNNDNQIYRRRNRWFLIVVYFFFEKVFRIFFNHVIIEHAFIENRRVLFSTSVNNCKSYLTFVCNWK